VSYFHTYTLGKVTWSAHACSDMRPLLESRDLSLTHGKQLGIAKECPLWGAFLLFWLWMSISCWVLVLIPLVHIMQWWISMQIMHIMNNWRSTFGPLLIREVASFQRWSLAGGLLLCQHILPWVAKWSSQARGYLQHVKRGGNIFIASSLKQITFSAGCSKK